MLVGTQPSQGGFVFAIATAGTAAAEPPHSKRKAVLLGWGEDASTALVVKDTDPRGKDSVPYGEN